MENLIKFELSKTGEATIDFDGNIPDLTAGILTMIKTIYHTVLLNGGEIDAKWLVSQIVEAMTNPENPMYKEFYEVSAHE